ncbi:hypothetical protein HK405_002957 [Cladochytrium tenue]|nr:hypothetical protein HK405_002957 [Cladochytrium tenue]
MQSAEIETKRLPTIERLAKVFNCTFNPIVSIGFVVRSETLDTFPPAPYVNGATAFDGEKRFWSIVHAYPHVESILRDSGRYTLLHNYYGPTRGTYYTRRNMSYYQDTVAGEGWYGLGISVGFTSPLISPGINCICLPTGFLAARLTAKQLDGSDGAAADARDEYSAFLTKLVEGLRAVDEILYNMFRHPRLFQSIFPLYFANGMADVTKNYTTEFRPQEIHWANGSGEAMFPKWSTEVLPLVMDTDITDEVVAKVEEICARHCRLHVETFHEWTKYSRYMRYYDDDMQYRPNKGWRPEADFPAIRCTQCKYANALQHSLHCVMCDATLPQYTRPSVTGEISMTVLAQ